jgi:hypothetical protein
MVVSGPTSWQKDPRILLRRLLLLADPALMYMVGHLENPPSVMEWANLRCAFHLIYFWIYREIYMGKPLMIQEEDERRIEDLKRRLGIQRKVDVLRAGIELLEREAERRDRVRRWKRSAALVATTSREVNAGFQRHSRLKRT